MNPSILLQAILNGSLAAQHYVAHNQEGANWYPCGFAWATYKCRKNAAESIGLVASGWTWDDYRKVYTLSMGKFHNTQSMDYKEAIGYAFAGAANAYLTDKGFPASIGIRTHID